jgi:hypothetical protein
VYLRKSCLKSFTYFTLGTDLTLPPAKDVPLIRVADKPKQVRWLHNVFIDDKGFPDKPEYYDNLLHNIDGGPILHKLKHPPPSFNEVDPKFFCTYDES